MEGDEVIVVTDVQSDISLYFQNKTYVQITQKTTRGDKYWNGFITKVNNDSISFFDVIDRIEFPVSYNHISCVEISTRQTPDSTQGKEIWEESKK